jgi:anti-sigma B factor antagonist
MSLSVEAHHCGTVYVIRCSGRIVVGEESEVLEAAVNRGLREFVRLVVTVSEVSHVDSTGMGLLVRFLSHTRDRGGDVRLAASPPFLSKLLQLTRLDRIFRLYASEDKAIMSFLKEPHATAGDATTGPMVLFVDQSPDLCAFVRVLLHRHGYQAQPTCRVHDAKTLMTATKFDYIVLGPDTSHLPSDSVAATLRSLAPAAAIVPLQGEFKHADPEQAGLDLLRAIQGAAKS